MTLAMNLAAFVARPPQVRWFRFTAPAAFYALAGRLLPWCWGAAALFGLAGLVLGLGLAPTDLQQGDVYRVIFIHVPAVCMSLVIYVVIAGWVGLSLVLNARPSSMMTTALAPTGALMTFIALWTGALWGKPFWGTWWVWDAHLTAELVLLLLYLGLMVLQACIADPRRSDRAVAILALAGMVTVPIICFSVKSWNTLYPGSGIDFTRAPSMSGMTLGGILLMAAAFWAWSIAVALHRVRSIILESEQGSEWAAELPEARS
jgi:heme exporter protein C